MGPQKLSCSADSYFCLTKNVLTETEIIGLSYHAEKDSQRCFVIIVHCRGPQEVAFTTSFYLLKSDQIKILNENGDIFKSLFYFVPIEL